MIHMSQEKTITPLSRFWRLLKPDAAEIRNVYIYAAFNGLINLSLPIGIQAIINIIQGGEINFSWFVLILFVSGGIALAGIIQVSQLRITENLQQKIFTRAAFEFTYRIPRIRLDALYKHYAPELMNRFFDVVAIQKGLSKVIVDFSSAAIQIIFGLILLSFYHPFFIAFSLVLVVLVYLIFRITAARGLETSLSESKNKYKIAHRLEELARTNMTFKLAGKTDLPLEMIESESMSYIHARESHFNILKLQYKLMIWFKIIIALTLLVMGSLLVMNQQMNIGQFVAAEIIIILVLNSVEKVILSLETIYDVLTSLEKVGQVSDLELEDESGMDMNGGEKKQALSVELIDVAFSYPGHQRKVLDDLSLAVKSGERVLITGDSDSGKSTLLYLMSALYSPTKGSVLIDGLPIRSYNPRSLRDNIGDCLMDEQLFDGTIYENISLGRKGVTTKDVMWALDKVGLTDLIKRLPDGLNTIVMPEGLQFSKGAIDKFILARSIVDRPGLLLIKDNFSLFSEEERDRLICFLIDKSNPWTLIIASSNRNLEKYVDRMIVLNAGKQIS